MAALEKAFETPEDGSAATYFDEFGKECLLGLSSLETQEYRLLQKIALHGDDQSFLRYIELGDQHEAALIRRRKEEAAG